MADLFVRSINDILNDENTRISAANPILVADDYELISHECVSQFDTLLCLISVDNRYTRRNIYRIDLDLITPDGELGRPSKQQTFLS